MNTEAAATTPLVAVCERLGLSPAARALASEVDDPETLTRLLTDKQHYQDALLLTAGRLPRRQMIWWGCVCAWHVGRPMLPAAAEAALHAVVRWLQDPGETSRCALARAAETAGLHTTAGAIAQAAFWSEGSMIAAGLPEVTAPPLAAPRLIVAALAAAAQSGPDGPDACKRCFLDLAAQLTNNPISKHESS